MSNTKIIKAEIKELNECIQVIDWNLRQKIDGLPSATNEDFSTQMNRKQSHLARIAELKQKLDGMK